MSDDKPKPEPDVAAREPSREKSIGQMQVEELLANQPKPEPSDVAALIAKLNSQVGEDAMDGQRCLTLRNPDGPEAVAELTRLGKLLGMSGKIANETMDALYEAKAEIARLREALETARTNFERGLPHKALGAVDAALSRYLKPDTGEKP